MDEDAFRLSLYLPAQGAAETEATIIEWCISEGDRFEKGQVLAQIDSAKSVFDFEAPCSGLLIRLLHLEGETVSYDEPVMEIETSDSSMKDWIPPAATAAEVSFPHAATRCAEPREETPQTAACPGCGQQVDPQHKFCPRCGARLETDGTPSSLICSQCGSQALPGQKFCAQCGAPLSEPSGQ